MVHKPGDRFLGGESWEVGSPNLAQMAECPLSGAAGYTSEEKYMSTLEWVYTSLPLLSLFFS